MKDYLYDHTITLEEYKRQNVTRPLTGDCFGSQQHKRSRNTKAKNQQAS